MEKGEEVSETGNWNIADPYSKIKIALPLNFCDVYADMAKFGYHSILDQIINHGMSIDDLRLLGLTRLISELLKIISNSKFALKRNKSRKEAEAYEKQLQELETILPAISKQLIDTVRKTRRTRLIQPQFDKVLAQVLEIKTLLNGPLNENDLIFTHKEEYDYKKRKADIVNRLKNQG